MAPGGWVAQPQRALSLSHLMAAKSTNQDKHRELYRRRRRTHHLRTVRRAGSPFPTWAFIRSSTTSPTLNLGPDNISHGSSNPRYGVSMDERTASDASDGRLWADESEPQDIAKTGYVFIILRYRACRSPVDMTSSQYYSYRQQLPGRMPRVLPAQQPA